MISKKLLIIFAASASLVIPFSVFAASSDASYAKNIRGFFGINASKLTEQQKADVKEYSQKMADLQKDFINKMVANGSITQEQADAQIKRIDEMLANGGEYGFMPGFGMGKGGFGLGKGSIGLGKNSFEMKKIHKGYGMFSVDPSKLTDSQKADITDSYIKMSELQKEYVNKMVSSGILDQEKGDSLIKKIEDLENSIKTDGISKNFGLNGAFGLFNGLMPKDSSKLTDEQKAIINEYSNKMTELKKELINTMVSNGTITQEQADAELSRNDNSKQSKGRNFSEKKEINKGRFEGNKSRGRTIPGKNKGSSSQSGAGQSS